MGQASAFLWAYVFRAGMAGPVTDQTLDAALASPDAWVWMHLPLSDQRSRVYLQDFADLPAPARDLILQTEQRVQIQFADAWAYGVLADFERDLDGHSMDAGRLHFALGPRRLITARRQALCVIDEVRREIDKGAPPASPTDALVRLIERYVDVAERRLNEKGEALDRLEDKAMLGDAAELESVNLGPVRRGLARDHREYLGVRSALHRAMSPREAHRVDLLPPHLPRLAQEAEDLDREAVSLQERARLLHEEIEAKINSATNRSMRALTIMSTLLIPPTLIVGAFGMNLPGIPFDQKGGFLAASVLCLAVVGAAYMLLRRMKIMP